MNEHPIEGLMLTAMNSIRDMVDVNTIIGEPIETINDVMIIPISKVGFGFAAGGSEFTSETAQEYTRKDKEENIEYKLPFGGGSGAGVSITPVAFLIVQGENVKLLHVSNNSAIDRLLDYVPDLLDKANEMLNKKNCDKEEMKVEEVRENSFSPRVHPKKNKIIKPELQNRDNEEIIREEQEEPNE